MTSHYTRGSVTIPHDFGGVMGRPLDTFFLGLSQLHGHSSWLVCEVALIHFKIGHRSRHADVLRGESEDFLFFNRNKSLAVCRVRTTQYM